MRSGWAILASRERRLPSWLPPLVLLGAYLTLRGYHSFDGDQAYRLPLLLHRQDPGLYADDPFVRALDDFNPHRGSLVLLDIVSRPIGLPAGLFVVFALTFLATCWGVRRLAGAVWPEQRRVAGWVAIGLVLSAKAGNIGTNHLFEAMVLDRLVALALGWVAIALTVTRPSTSARRSAMAVALATIVHPTVGLQLAMVLTSSWLAWALLGRRSAVSAPTAMWGLAWLGVAVVPGVAIALSQRAALLGGLPPELFWLLSVELQNPQHMLPHLWRMPQWLAWCSYFALAFLTLGTPRSERPAGSMAVRLRLWIMLGLILVGLGVAWSAIELGHNVRVTIFQPFRMGTVARGIALILVSGRLVALWRTGSAPGRIRAAVLAAGFLGDWLLVVATVAELTVSAIDRVRQVFGSRWIPHMASILVHGMAIAYGLNFLAHHDTESGHVPLAIAIIVGGIAGMRRNGTSSLMETPSGARSLPAFSPRMRIRWVVTAMLGTAWLLPVCALVAALIPARCPAARSALVRGLVDRCRFYPVPLDDIERLSVWCREHTPESARFIGPPGPKTFRLWSRRSLAFNRSGSPYHGEGLADWFARFSDHVDHHGTAAEFIRAYVTHRHDFEARYQAMSDSQRAALAVRQAADHVIAEAPRGLESSTPQTLTRPLELLHVEGRYAVYRVNPAALVQHHR